MDRMLALYADHQTAEQVRTHLFADGFPTDRVEVTSLRDLGQAGAFPHRDAREALEKYFTVLFDEASDRELAGRVTSSVEEGKASVTVHPRGEVEIERAREILRGHGALDLVERVAPVNKNQPLGEYAAGFNGKRNAASV